MAPSSTTHLRTQIRIYEVDHPATQAGKCQRLANAGITLPPGLTFVPVDFERTSRASSAAAFRGSRLDTLVFMLFTPKVAAIAAMWIR